MMEEPPSNAMNRLRTVHPGHVLFGISLPFCYQAYRDYTKHSISLERTLAQDIVRHYPGAYQNENARRAVGMAVGMKALKIATFGSIGVFGISLAGMLYMTGCDTIDRAIQKTTDWAHEMRSAWDDAYDIQRVDRNHPEYQANLKLSEQEELEKYFPAKDYLDNDEKD